MTLFIDQAAMRLLGHKGSPLWTGDSPVLSAPLTANFAVTHRCDVGCQHCYNNSGQALPSELTTDEVKQVISILAQMRVFTVAFGGGEPLTRPDIFELAGHARQCGLTPTLTTSGFPVDAEVAQRCRVFAHIHLSLDGVGETYRAVRGVDGFPQVERAISLLRRERISLGINCVVSRANFDGLEELARYLRSEGIRDIAFLRLKPKGRALKEYEAHKLTAEQRLGLYPLLQNLTRRFGIRTHIDCATMPMIYAHRPDPRALARTVSEGCCGGNYFVEIGPDGEARSCSFLGEGMGRAEELPAYWASAPHLDSYRSRTQATAEPCRDCAYVSLCRGGCHAVAQALVSDFRSPDPECPLVQGGVRYEPSEST